MNAKDHCLVRTAPQAYGDPRYYGRPVPNIGKVRVLNAGGRGERGDWYVTYGTHAEIVEGSRDAVARIVRARFGHLVGGVDDVLVRPMTDEDWIRSAEITRDMRNGNPRSAK